MRNQTAWNFAQHYSSILLIYAGLLLTAFSSVGLFFKLTENFEVIISTIAALIGIAIPIYHSEKALKLKFDEKYHKDQ